MVNSSSGEVISSGNILVGDTSSVETSNNSILASMNEQFASVSANQKTIFAEIITLKKLVQEMYSWMAESKNNSAAISNDDKSVDEVPFKKIGNEAELHDFEAKIGGDNKHDRLKFVKMFTHQLGVGRMEWTARTTVLNLFDLIFVHSFWCLTAWTGGRKPKPAPNTESDENMNDESQAPEGEAVKFAFSSHATVISFLIEVVKAVCGATLSLPGLGDAVQMRTRNSGYVRKTKRAPTQRIKRPKLSNNDADKENDNSGASSKLAQS